MTIKGQLLFLGLFLIIAAAPPGTARAAAFSLDEHWNIPIPIQGSPPDSYTETETSLLPASCGVCHENQYTGWKGSRHAVAMGPGVSGQFHAPWVDGEEETACLNCHAPLTEQWKMIPSKEGTLADNKTFISQLRQKGVTCAACHVRNHLRYGPKRRGEAVPEPPHGGFIAAEEFGDSRFCRPCHQFEAEDNRVAGKLLQNTFEEWKASGYPEKGIHCQNCHMPDRAHLWRGIHDPEMVKKGVTVNAERVGDTIKVMIANSGTGHNFPTYVTPRVTLKGVVLDEKGREIPGSADEAHIGWSVALDLSKEYDDSRIAPGGSFNGNFDWERIEGGKKVVITIDVYPDDFYRRFFEALMNDPPEGIDLKKIGLAYEETKRSNYRVFRKEFDI